MLKSDQTILVQWSKVQCSVYNRRICYTSNVEFTWVTWVTCTFCNVNVTKCNVMQCNKNNLEFTRVLELLGSGATFLESSPGNFDNSNSHQHYPPPSVGIIVIVIIITFTIMSSWFLPLASHLDINHIICNIF